jgi:hypothetical protein
MKIKLSLSIGFTASFLLISPTLAGEIVIIRGVGDTNPINRNVIKENNFTNINRSVIYPSTYPNLPNIIYQNNSSATYTNGTNGFTTNNINSNFNHNINRQIINQEVFTQNTVTIVNLNNDPNLAQPTTPTPVTSIGNIRQNTIIRSDSFTNIRRSEIFRTLRGFD